LQLSREFTDSAVMLKNTTLSFLCIFAVISIALAQDESITFTTYYPSPYGSYRQLDTNSLSIVNTAESTGAINFQGSNIPPANANPGSLYFNNKTGQFMYMDNMRNWRQLGGEGCQWHNFSNSVNTSVYETNGGNGGCKMLWKVSGSSSHWIYGQMNKSGSDDYLVCEVGAMRSVQASCEKAYYYGCK